MMIRSALEIMAHRHAHDMGHHLDGWSAAKPKIGKDAMKSVCLTCGKSVFLLPHGYPKARQIVKNTPGIRGDALFEPCQARP